MKAILVKEHGGPEKLVFTKHHLPEPGPNQVLVEVKYAGVNFPDTLIIKGKYQFQPDIPFSPGGEVSGVIKKVGAGVENFKEGDRVVSGTSWGGFAEEALGFASNTFHLPDEVSFKDAAAFLMTFGTAIHALKDRAQLREGETLAILGASGGVGSASIQLGKWLGANIIACASTEEKLAYSKSLGADNQLLYDVKSLKSSLKELTNGKGVDVIIDMVGGEYTEQAFRAIAPMGRYLIIGFATGQVPSMPLNLPLLKSASLIGVFWGNFFRNYPKLNAENIYVLLDLLKRGEIHVHIDRIIRLERASEALSLIENRSVKGKLLLEV